MPPRPACYWIVDNGSSHRGQASIDRLQGRWKNLVLVHTPGHATWLNQSEIYYSILQQKVLTFTRSKLRELMQRLERLVLPTQLAA